MTTTGLDKPSFSTNAFSIGLYDNERVRIAFQDFDDEDRRRYTHCSVVLTLAQTRTIIKELQTMLDKVEPVQAA